MNFAVFLRKYCRSSCCGADQNEFTPQELSSAKKLKRQPSIEIELKTVRFSHFSRYNKILFCLLLPALLLAQWVGLAHRIAHAGIANNQQTTSFAVAANSHSLLSNLPFNDDPKHHSCIALDATTCADFLHTPTALLVVHANGQTAPLPDQFKLVLLQIERFYLSRAPPPLISAHT